MTDLKTREEIIQYIFDRGERKIKISFGTACDRVAKFHVELLQDLDAEEKSMELYKIYEKHA